MGGGEKMSGRNKFFLIIFVIIIMSTISLGVQLELLSHPQNADVYVDRVWRGNTPLMVDLSPGNHLIRVSKNGYQEQEEQLDIRMPTVIEYNLNPVKEISKEFPLVLYLTNYQQSGSRKILYRENEDQLINSLQNRFEEMGFTISVEKPIDEFDLVMDNISVYEMLSERHPQARLFMIVNGLWSYSSFREKKITRLETQVRIYDPKTSITLGNFQDISESIGMLGTEITILQAVEKATQNFLDNIGNYMVERVRKDVKRPILAFNEKHKNGQLYLFKSEKPIDNINLYDEQEGLIESTNIPLDKLPVNITFLVDRSGSNEKEIPMIKSQIESLLQTLPVGFEWSLMGFDDKIEIIQSFTNDYIQWEFAKDQIVSSGMTRLYDAIYNAATILARKDGVKILILLTDGIDSDYYDTGLGSIRTEEEALNAIGRSGMIVYPIGVSQKNYESLLNKIAYLSATDYFDINNYQPDELSNLIAKDLTYNIGTAIVTEKIAPELYSINGYKYIKEPDSRFLNQFSLIREPVSIQETEIATEKTQTKEKELDKTDSEEKFETKVETTEKNTTDEKELKKVEEPQKDDSEAVQEIKEPTKEDKEMETRMKSETASEEDIKDSESIQKTTKPDVEDQEIVSGKQTTEPQIKISEESTENLIDYPADFNQLLKLNSISNFDLDKFGNLVWAQDDILYFYIPAEERIAGISISSRLKGISFHFPYLSILSENELKILMIENDSILEINSFNITLPLAFFKLINEKYLLLGYENGLVQVFSLKSEIINEWQLESGVINQAVVDEKGQIIISTTTGRIGWSSGMKNELTMIKIDKPVVGLSPFDVDQERFLIVDASGSVYFQRFENTKPTVRNLNRGIVLKAGFAESNNMLFANHWDKTLRGYRIFDLNETVLFRSKKGIESFEVDIYADKVLISTVDQELYYFSKNTTLPQNLEKIYGIEIPESEETEVSVSKPIEKSTNEEETKAKEEEKISDVNEEEKNIDMTEEYYGTNINLSEVKKENTQKASEMDQGIQEEKEEEIAIILDGKVIVGDVNDKTNTPIPSEKKTERELTSEELQGFEAIYGGWKKAVAYKDYGYILAGDSNMRIANPLLQTIKNISYQKSLLLDASISKYNILALLFDSRIEIWDVDNLYSTKDISKINSYKFPVSDGREIVFSRNGEYLLLLRN